MPLSIIRKFSLLFSARLGKFRCVERPKKKSFKNMPFKILQSSVFLRWSKPLNFDAFSILNKTQLLVLIIFILRVWKFNFLGEVKIQKLSSLHWNSISSPVFFCIMLNEKQKRALKRSNCSKILKFPFFWELLPYIGPKRKRDIYNIFPLFPFLKDIKNAQILNSFKRMFTCGFTKWFSILKRRKLKINEEIEPVFQVCMEISVQSRVKPRFASFYLP